MERSQQEWMAAVVASSDMGVFWRAQSEAAEVQIRSRDSVIGRQDADAEKQHEKLRVAEFERDAAQLDAKTWKQRHEEQAKELQRVTRELTAAKRVIDPLRAVVVIASDLNSAFLSTHAWRPPSGKAAKLVWRYLPMLSALMENYREKSAGGPNG